MRLRAEAVLDDAKRMVVVSYFDWETPQGRRQRGEADGYQPPGNWPFNLVPHRMVPLPMIHRSLAALTGPTTDTRHLSGWR